MTLATARVELALALEEAARRKARRLRLRYFPDTGPLRRGLYPKHLEFFAAGRTHRRDPRRSDRARRRSRRVAFNVRRTA